MALPEQRVIERMDVGIVVTEQRQRQSIGLMPGLAVDNDFGLFLADQLFGALGGGFRHHHRNRQAQTATGVGDGDPGITA
ncbi:hypothetical protein D3C86_1935770 [compost metagenome]